VGVVEEAETATVVDPEPATLVGLKETAAPAGKPLFANVTMPANPPSEATASVSAKPCKRMTDWLSSDDAEMLRSPPRG